MFHKSTSEIWLHFVLISLLHWESTYVQLIDNCKQFISQMEDRKKIPDSEWVDYLIVRNSFVQWKLHFLPVCLTEKYFCLARFQETCNGSNVSAFYSLAWFALKKQTNGHYRWRKWWTEHDGPWLHISNTGKQNDISLDR